MAAIACILLVAGGLGALQSASVLFGAPFGIIMVLMCLAFYLHLRSEGSGEDRRADEDSLAPRQGRTPSAGDPAPGQAFAAEEPAPGYNRQPGIEQPGKEGR
jgi:choline-glycine betaine transporter